MQYIPFPSNTTFGSRIKSALGRLENGVLEFQQVRGSMALMIDNAGSLDSDYAKMATQCGFADGTAARAAFVEIDTLFNKFNTDGSVTNLKTNLAQVFNEFRA